MPAQSFQRPTIGQFSINLPSESFIKRFVAIHSVDEWLLAIETETGQTAFIQTTEATPMRFATLDNLAHWLASQDVLEMSVFLPQNDVGGAA
ncbi:MAG: hypothetical protein RI556_11225 [Hydrogenovibrio sp.]|uniref:hypothetical protein n=1 Tax=Hydrogenovibrio sp. TaxID=2065821 RepID=UPI00287095EC|nr:hypothetical protein [Hydrogenovibrio sp.]MDR9499737.1 hypothetical protein [Hydrogenovibrio sp.]